MRTPFKLDTSFDVETPTDAVDVGNRKGQLSFQVLLASETMTAFILQILLHDEGDWIDFIGASEWSATDNVNKPFTSSDLSTMSSGTVESAVVNLPACRKFRFVGSTDAIADVEILGTFTGEGD